MRIEVGSYMAQYRDGRDIVVRVATKCRDESAARQVLARLEREAERVRAGLVTPTELKTAEHGKAPIEEHVDAYLTSLEARGTTTGHVREARRILTRIFHECGFRALADLDAATVESWLNERRKAGASARTRNVDRAALVAFAGWCAGKAVRRLIENPFVGLPRADEKADRRRQRRALTEDELRRLLDATRKRPLLDALTVRRGKMKGTPAANVRPEVREQLEALGRERALIVKTMALTGLRKGELASLTAGSLHLDAPGGAYAELRAADEKNREGNTIPLRADLADDLRAWLADKLDALQGAARLKIGGAVPMALPATTSLFTVPAGLVRILDRDLKAAGIPKRDERGRTIDVHALRHTFGTLLSKGGVAPRTAQQAMRHANIDLTMNVYTDPKLLDVAGALGALPDLPLDGTGEENEAAKATGTAGRGPENVAPFVALTPGKSWQIDRRPDMLTAGNETFTDRLTMDGKAELSR